MEATWQEADGRIVREAGQATEVSAQGGLLEMRTYPPVGTQIELTGLLSHESSQARVAAVRRNSDNIPATEDALFPICATRAPSRGFLTSLRPSMIPA